MFGKNIKHCALFFIALFAFGASAAQAQMTAFTYQGRLTDTGVPANGTYQFEFKLYDTQTVGTGTQIGPTITGVVATVTGGVFAVQPDFGPGTFDGSRRYLEIGVRLNGNPNPYIVLSSRQQITTAPYAIRSNSALRRKFRHHV